MSTGLIRQTTNDPEWVLEFCGFKYPPGDPRGRGAWEIPAEPRGAQRGEGVTVVHPDTGYTSHPELVKGRRYDFDRARNFHEPKLLAKDRLLGSFPSHGTSTASVLISAEGHPNLPPPSSPLFPDYREPPDKFVSGVAPMARVIPCLVTQDNVMLDGHSTGALANAIYYAMSLSEVGVISISLGRMNPKPQKGPDTPVSSLRTALFNARMEGIVVCAAAGQADKRVDWMLRPIFPGSDPNTICVAMCDHENNKPELGFYGPEVDISAPGVGIWIARTARIGGTPVERHFIETSKGSSYATAIVAGACALWQAHHGRAYLIEVYGKPLIFDAFKKVLKDSCYTPPNWDPNRGAGVLDAVRLLTTDLPPKSEIEQFHASEIERFRRIDEDRN